MATGQHPLLRPRLNVFGHFKGAKKSNDFAHTQEIDFAGGGTIPRNKVRAHKTNKSGPGGGSMVLPPKVQSEKNRENAVLLGSFARERAHHSWSPSPQASILSFAATSCGTRSLTAVIKATRLRRAVTTANEMVLFGRMTLTVSILSSGSPLTFRSRSSSTSTAPTTVPSQR